MFTEVHTQYEEQYKVFVGTLVHVDDTAMFTFPVKHNVLVELPMTNEDMCALVAGAVIDFGINNGVEVVLHGLYIH